MLSDKKLKSLRGREKRYEVADKEGLSIRVTPKGAKTFQYRYRFFGKPDRIDYGSYPEISLSDAREYHRKDRALLEKGLNPKEVKEQYNNAKINSPSLSDLANEFYTRYMIKELKRPDHAYAYLERDILPRLGKKKAKEISRRNLVVALDNIVDRGAPVSANRTLSVVKKMFQYAIERGILESNPAIGITKKSIGGIEKSKERYLSESEIKLFWLNLDTAPFSKEVANTLKLLLLTGVRVSEVVEATWSEFNMDKGIWTIPSERTKNKIPLKVPLHSSCLSVIKELKQLSGESIYLTRSPQNSDTHLNYRSVCRAVKRHLAYFQSESPWTPHDLRRTFSTHLNKLKISEITVEKLLNHQLQGVLKVYNRYEYWDEKVEALKIWEEKIKQIAAGEKVIPMKRKVK